MAQLPALTRFVEKESIAELTNSVNDLDDIYFKFCKSVHEAEEELLEIMNTAIAPPLSPRGTLVLTT
ncbi:hypothetical protein GTQ43_13005 [Nostoc sp. KVJ3]|uniref:hypothetical protein n=1 Tax=Nostoc sp. KVJ3 TaxID=457945 RepID=UPI0022382D73|nr:hypothetical protein [Nostoc sp. KVJ3]MCW5314697.1 hypothetical protein [Nostoc sp. KVJ3]